jgi:release factor glutamine methyltransferase
VLHAAKLTKPEFALPPFFGDKVTSLRMQQGVRTYQEVKKHNFDQPLAKQYDAGELRAMWLAWLVSKTNKTTQSWANLQYEAFPDHLFHDLAATVASLQTGKPLQYVLNEAYFLDRKFVLNESVLIPRPETEELVLWMLESLPTTDLKLIDLGTGSGIIPISLKLARPNWQLTGVELSPEAMATAKSNGALHAADVQWQEGDMLTMALPPWDVLVSNPPYIPYNEADSLAPHVLQFEPAMALFSPTADALLFYKAIAKHAHQAPAGKQLFLELNHEKALEIEGLFEGMKTELRADLQGKARMLRVIT